MTRSEVWLGDLLHVFEELRPGDAEAAAVAKMLKLDRTVAAAEGRPVQGTWSSDAAPERAASLSRIVQVPSAESTSRVPSNDDKQTRALLRLIQTATGKGGIHPPRWAPFTGTLAPPAQKPSPPPTPPPLIARRVQRAILTATLATVVPDGPPDMDRIIDCVTRCRPLTKVPRRAMTTLRHGVQVLSDGWAGMTPFAADQQNVIEAMRTIFPPDNFERLRFSGCPTRGAGPGPRKAWRPWRPPSRRKVVIVLSDLGIGGPLLDPERAETAEWLRFARAVRAAGCSLVALVPYAPARWPKELAESMTLIHWSERLTAGAVRRGLRRHQRLAP